MVAVETLLGSTQPALTLAAGTLLGRVGIGPGGPQPVLLGSGLLLNAGVLSPDTTVLAPLASPGFTGVPTAPTPGSTDSSTALATTAFVQSHIVPFTLPPATFTTLGGVKVGSGLAVAIDGTTTLAAALPAGTNASAATVTASLTGALPRRLADIRGDIIHVADLLGAASRPARTPPPPCSRHWRSPRPRRAAPSCCARGSGTSPR